ncbi:hypothetical protein NBRC10513v2_003122 [Rhodotorula toruloides]|uniref:Uncharacterized protein n=1 Tax=Rhodotorula toruloides TaxID=5286 RepID=A0A0K3CER9_RHOTO|nr:hypothetical protein AAT19DRAFT_14284 [Rhodotorula toruloides]
MLRYFRVPGLRITRSAKPPPRPIKAVKSPARVTEAWAFPRGYPHVDLARWYILNAGLPSSQRFLEASAEGDDMTKAYQEALRLEQASKAGGVCPPNIKRLLSRDEDTLSEPEYQKLAKWADQWGSKVARRYMMLEHGQPVLPWPHIRPILESVYKDSKMTEQDWQKEEESFNRLARGMAEHYKREEEAEDKKK